MRRPMFFPIPNYSKGKIGIAKDVYFSFTVI